MLHIKATAVRFTEAEAYPGWVECRFLDAFGKEWIFEEKCPYVAEQIFPGAQFPQDAAIPCEQTDEHKDAEGRSLVTVTTLRPIWIEAITGESVFVVLREQLIDS